jgi:hypothetical protein
MAPITVEIPLLARLDSKTPKYLQPFTDDCEAEVKSSATWFIGTSEKPPVTAYLVQGAFAGIAISHLVQFVLV